MGVEGGGVVANETARLRMDLRRCGQRTYEKYFLFCG